MPSDDGWVTWPEAAEIVGCPVPTIDWYSRLGRIEKRPFRGRRPTLKRTSVEEFARWWAERTAARERRRRDRQTRDSAARARARVRRPPTPPRGHVSVAHAAQVLGVSASHVSWLASRGHLKTRAGAGRTWVMEESVTQLLAHRQAEAEWISIQEAAQLTGSTPGAIQRAVDAGQIVRRDAPRHRPSLNRASVELFAAAWSQRPTGRVQEDAPTVLDVADELQSPLDADHVWLTAGEVASLFGISATRVHQLARRDSLPFVVHEGRRWFRDDLIKLTMKARQVRRRGSAARPWSRLSSDAQRHGRDDAR